MKRALLFTFCLLVLWCPVFTQSTHIVLPTNAPMHYNPGFAGTLDKIRLNAAFRADWVSLPGTYRTAYLSGDWLSHTLKGGVGFEGMYRTFGEGNFQMAKFSGVYAGKISLGQQWTLSPALKAGFVTSDIWFVDDSGSGTIDHTRQTLNFSPGLVINTAKFYFGTALENAGTIILDSLPRDLGWTNAPLRTWTVQAGYNFRPYENAPWSLSASAMSLVRRTLVHQQLLMTFQYKIGLVGVGATFNGRISDLIANLGVKTRRMRLGIVWSCDLGQLGGIVGPTWEGAASFYINRKKNSSSPEASRSF